MHCYDNVTFTVLFERCVYYYNNTHCTENPEENNIMRVVPRTNVELLLLSSTIDQKYTIKSVFTKRRKLCDCVQKM